MSAPDLETLRTNNPEQLGRILSARGAQLVVQRQLIDNLNAALQRFEDPERFDAEPEAAYHLAKALGPLLSDYLTILEVRDAHAFLPASVTTASRVLARVMLGVHGLVNALPDDPRAGDPEHDPAAHRRFAEERE